MTSTLPAPHRRPHRGRARARAAVDPAEAELASRLRLAVTRLHRRLRQHADRGADPVAGLGAGRGGPARLADARRPGRPRVRAAADHDHGRGRRWRTWACVTRVTDPADRRVARLTLTAAGRGGAPPVAVAADTPSWPTACTGSSPADRAALADLTDLLERLVDMDDG